ncbi:peptidylprolyl isomerase [Streptomyces synnematoformans]|uniref:Peptidylprolyl isomerase n=1 Tax=Streptomyces synnematoformans TaxID=415721 RepID=A0ABN2Z0Q3_9ACTN
MVSKDQRRRQLAREKYERQQRRRADRRKHNRKLAAIIAAPLVVVITAVTVAAATGFGSGDDDEKKDDAAAPSESAEKPHDPCGKPEKGKASKKTWKKEPKLDIDESATYTMTLSTTCGDIGIEMDAGKAPHTVNSMNFLAGEGYFDHSPCHRLTGEESGIFVLQCGDPAGTGQGGPGYTIPDENLKDKRVKGGTYPAGTVAMANTGQKDSGGSQFFLVYEDSPLPPNYTPFGTITDEGMSTVKMIAEAGAQPPDQTGSTAPNATVVINKATVTKGTEEQEKDH